MGAIRVVLVEDHDLTRVSLRTALQQRGGIELVAEAADGRQGQHCIETERPDVAIIDIGLPDIDGIELTRRFKQAQARDERLQHTKVLILTLYDSREAVLAAFAAGADSYCMKSINFDVLTEALKLTQEGESWIDPAIAKIVLSHARLADSASEGGNGPQSTGPNDNAAPAHAEAATGDPSQAAYPLTERELEVLRSIVDGASNAEIAQQLYITVGTVKTHVRNILNKLCAEDRTQAAVRALRSGLIG